jgi:diguanylate cyclase (GGDEF)-like protein
MLRVKPSDMVLLYVDFDDFKSLSESPGRQVGDLLLAVVADQLRNLLANDDVLTRLAADEFVIMRPALHTEPEVKMLVSRMLTRLAEAYDIEGQRLSISASIAPRQTTVQSNSQKSLWITLPWCAGTIRFAGCCCPGLLFRWRNGPRQCRDCTRGYYHGAPPWPVAC